MLDAAEAAAVAEEFGVTDEQVRRDHLLSHLLAVLSANLPDAVVFFGGTALARTHLPDGRLSEDLDLYAVPRRADVVAEIEKVLADGVRREYGRLTWDPPLASVRDVDPAVLRPLTGSPCGCSCWTRHTILPGRPSGADLSSATATHRPQRLPCRLGRRSPRRRLSPGTTGTHPATCTTCGGWPALVCSTQTRRSCSPRSARPGVPRNRGCSPTRPPLTPGPSSWVGRPGSRSVRWKRSPLSATPGWPQ